MLLHLSDDPTMHFLAGVALDILGVLLIEEHYRLLIFFISATMAAAVSCGRPGRKDQWLMRIFRIELILEG